MQVQLVPDLPTDSDNYDVLTEAVQRIQSVEGLTCEIGLRRAGGTKFILDAIKATQQNKTHIAIDPYGNIEYPQGDDNHAVRCDYTNSMCIAFNSRPPLSFLIWKTPSSLHDLRMVCPSIRPKSISSIPMRWCTLMALIPCDISSQRLIFSSRVAHRVRCGCLMM
jgi:hypothetical protein